MSAAVQQAELEETQNLEVILDGERLFPAYLGPGGRLFVDAVSGIIRLIGLAMLTYAALLLLQNDPVLGINIGFLGAVLFFGSLVGLRETQNAARRITLDPVSLTFTDSWTGVERVLSRGSCLEAQCGQGKDGCSVYITYPDNRIELLIEGLRQTTAEEIATKLNEHLCAQHANDAGGRSY